MKPKEVETIPVVMYTQPRCESCDAAKAWLAERHVDVRVYDIRDEYQTLDDFMETGSRTTPTLVVDDRILEGFHPDEWADALGVSK